MPRNVMFAQATWRALIPICLVYMQIFPDSPYALRSASPDYVKNQHEIPVSVARAGVPYSGSALADGEEMLKDRGTVEERGR
jgi:hypothetical protein